MPGAGSHPAACPHPPSVPSSSSSRPVPLPFAHFSNLLPLPSHSLPSPPSAPPRLPSRYSGLLEPRLGPLAIYFQATVGFSVLTARPSLNGEIHRSALGGELGVAGAPEPELTPLPPPRQSAPRRTKLAADSGITWLGGICQVSWDVSVFSVAGSCRNVPINTLHLQGFVHFPTETPQREGW